MASRVFLHIGLPKTGSTYLQDILRTNHVALVAQGLLLPGRRGDHYRAYLDVGGYLESGKRGDPGRVPGTWDALVAESHDWAGDVLFTSELFCGLRSNQIARVVEDLQPAEVHVIIVVRDLARSIPAAWQQSVKIGVRTSLSDYCQSIMDRTPATSRFREFRFPDKVLRRWSRHVPAQRIHVVTIAPPGSPRELLWQRFSQVIGVAPDSCRLTQTRSNESLGATEAELVRRVNVHVVPRMHRVEVIRWVRDELANRLLALRDDRQRFGVPEGALPWAAEESRRIAKILAERGYDVQGDLDELVSSPRDTHAHSPDNVGDEQLLAVATETIAELLVRLRDSHRRERVARRQLRRTRGRLRTMQRRQRGPRRALRRLRRAPSGVLRRLGLSRGGPRGSSCAGRPGSRPSRSSSSRR
ncbi:MAG: hypothetical protein ACRDOJ_04485 [Nocardioidaceae bacterium]